MWQQAGWADEVRLKVPLIITACFAPIAFVLFVGSIMGDCGSNVSREQCSAGKSAALQSNMVPLAIVYVILVGLSMVRRRGH